MSIVWKHIGFYIGRDWAGLGPLKWYKIVFAFGLFDRKVDAETFVTYKYVFSGSLWLIPNFIWWEEPIRQQPGRIDVQYRIVGIRGWPHYFRFLVRP